MSCKFFIRMQMTQIFKIFVDSYIKNRSIIDIKILQRCYYFIKTSNIIVYDDSI